jgi:FtsZ-interacting cell division protein ZipA
VLVFEVLLVVIGVLVLIGLLVMGRSRRGGSDPSTSVDAFSRALSAMEPGAQGASRNADEAASGAQGVSSDAEETASGARQPAAEEATSVEPGQSPDEAAEEQPDGSAR